MTFNTGTKVQVLKGKFADRTGTVVATRTDKNGTERVQVRLGNNVFSYMATSLTDVLATVDSTVDSTVFVPKTATV